ncbi:MAG: hypothetical protein GWN58_21995, partial [Anaerolineae bacterium]|nr:hypothetical protein [Anaerolineae bacterium]
MPATKQKELGRYLFYDLLNHLTAYLLHIAPKPGADYYQALQPLADAMGEPFMPFYASIQQQALATAKQIRFDVTLVRLSTKHIQNAKSGG